jgi:ABC-type nitrate/sulfonate/bicarbonate transport system permease component
LITSARNNFDTALVFVAILALVVIATTLYGTVAVIEKILLKWKQ